MSDHLCATFVLQRMYLLLLFLNFRNSVQISLIEPYFVRSFKTRSALNRHHQNHLGIKQHACDKCDYRATDRTAIRRHIMNRHVDAPMFPCKDCDKRFFSMRTLKVIYRRTIDKADKNSDLITKHFNFLLFQRHQANHFDHTSVASASLPFRCTECAFETRTKGALAVSNKHISERDCSSIFLPTCELFIIFHNLRTSSRKKCTIIDRRI